MQFVLHPIMDAPLEQVIGVHTEDAIRQTHRKINLLTPDPWREANASTGLAPALSTQTIPCKRYFRLTENQFRCTYVGDRFMRIWSAFGH